jgi:serine/threonine-protein kinase
MFFHRENLSWTCHRGGGTTAMSPGEDLALTRAKERIGQVLEDEWVLDGVLGIGGAGCVYSGHGRNGRPVAVKILHPVYAEDPAIRERFRREALAANTVRHPGVVEVIDSGETEGGLVFLVMERLEGETIDRKAQRSGGVLRPSEVLAVADAVLDVLNAAHDRKVIHRDIKPQNLFMTQNGTIKLLDFGLAGFEAASPESRGQPEMRLGWAMGTPGYMPPEQARGEWKEVDERSDIWALGATMYSLMSGKIVHQADTSQAIMLATASVPVPSLATVAPSVPRAVVELVDRALAFSRAARFSEARTMRAAVQSALGNL